MKSRRLRRRDDQRGQAIILVAVGMVAFLGLAALAIDVGSWYQEQRQLQSSVDASALAAAIDVPAAEGNGTTCTTPAATPNCDAQKTALDFLTTNVSKNPDSRSPTAPTATYPTPTGAGCNPSVCVAVDATRPTHGFLGGVINSVFRTVTVHAHAQAYIGPPSVLKNINSAAIDQAQYNQLCGSPCVLPKANVTVNFDFNPTESFPLLDLNSFSSSPTAGGTVSPPVMGSWIEVGDPAAIPVNMWYGANTGQKNGVKNDFCDGSGGEPSNCPDNYSNAALGLSNASVMLLPVVNQFDSGTGSYFVVGFAAFVITQTVKGSDWTGNKHMLTGDFVKFIATGLPAGPGNPSFGVFVVGLDG